MKNARAVRELSLRVRWLAAAALGAMVVLAPSMVRSRDLGRCARVNVPWPVVLPDGSVHDAGSVKLCLQQLWNPASGLHEIRINGTSIGLFMSRIGRSEGPATRSPVVVFRRNGTNEHSLVGYAWPHGETMRTYALHKFGKAPRGIAETARSLLLESENSEFLFAGLAR